MGPATRAPLTAEDMQIAAQARKWARSGAARAVRTGAGVSLEEMAEAVEASTASLRRWECGDCSPRGRAAARWGRILAALGQPNYHHGDERGRVPHVD